MAAVQSPTPHVCACIRWPRTPVAIQFAGGGGGTQSGIRACARLLESPRLRARRAQQTCAVQAKAWVCQSCSRQAKSL